MLFVFTEAFCFNISTVFDNFTMLSLIHFEPRSGNLSHEISIPLHFEVTYTVCDIYFPYLRKYSLTFKICFSGTFCPQSLNFLTKEMFAFHTVFARLSSTSKEMFAFCTGFAILFST